ncbi:hypothetical protein Y032_0009g498 [Ancylostoma ceylanicum]|uniref:Uncharacterized protein n=1 Tax=Ancylostoma ceylanicum TaxID=53326 RepID=A0A016VI46_9BILA|nr:hypothetical protein Y032_0009g498 [Ancylostoma ceylanicum]
MKPIPFDSELCPAVQCQGLLGQVLRVAFGEPCNCWFHPLLLKIIGTSVPKSREAGKCESRRRRVGALVSNNPFVSISLSVQKTVSTRKKSLKSPFP